MDALAPHSLPFVGAPEGMLLIEYPHALETMSLKPGPIVDRAGFASVLPSPLHASVLAPIGDELRFQPVDAGTIVAANPFASFFAPIGATLFCTSNFLWTPPCQWITTSITFDSIGWVAMTS
ncbi:MAG: hypothetical protein HYV07_25135 [Deltaproteobacteria bacterium]|nr:hypothetical protein [Deltaproteobacteria bacterium]